MAGFQTLIISGPMANEVISTMDQSGMANECTPMGTNGTLLCSMTGPRVFSPPAGPRLIHPRDYEPMVRQAAEVIDMMEGVPVTLGVMPVGPERFAVWIWSAVEVEPAKMRPLLDLVSSYVRKLGVRLH